MAVDEGRGGLREDRLLLECGDASAGEHTMRVYGVEMQQLEMK